MSLKPQQPRTSMEGKTMPHLIVLNVAFHILTEIVLAYLDHKVCMIRNSICALYSTKYIFRIDWVRLPSFHSFTYLLTHL